VGQVAKSTVLIKGTIGLVMVVVLLSGACSNPAANTEKIYAFDSLLQSQAYYLAQSRATLKKEVLMDGETQQSNLQPIDSLRWSNELEIFGQLSAMNKPVNADSYQVTQERDPQSNLHVKVFRASENLALKEVKLYYLNDLKSIRKIEGRLDEKNSLYKSARVLTMNFDEVNNKTMLTSYSISGGQHMILGDTVQFDIRAFITIQ
jgi:hypothetical protein